MAGLLSSRRRASIAVGGEGIGAVVAGGFLEGVKGERGNPSAGSGQNRAFRKECDARGALVVISLDTWDIHHSI